MQEDEFDTIKKTEDHNNISFSYVLSVAKSLALALQQIESIPPTPEPEIALPIYNWLEVFMTQIDVGKKTEKEKIVDNMKSFKEELLSQKQQIIYLENELADKSRILKSTEDMLQKEVLLRSLLETQKLELITALSEFKLHNATLNKEMHDMKYIQAQENSLASETQLIEEKKTKFAEFYESVEYVQKLNLGKNSSVCSRPNFNSLPRSIVTSSNRTYPICNAGRVFPSNNNMNNKHKELECVESRNINLNESSPKEELVTPEKQNSKGLKVFFDKIRRSNSRCLQRQLSETEFKRGGVRATASPRLGWSDSGEPPKEFLNWNIDDICIWLDQLGLGSYENEARRWLKDGSKLLINSSPVDIEKELKLKSLLHRKKIVLAVADLCGKDKDELFVNAGKLNNAWVMRWLDDIGLPQLKEFFASSQIDGRMLHKLTLDDLSPINLQSSIHIASLRYGIQVMREYKWNADCLIRRSTNDSSETNFVHLWTAHRVMEWLRAVDLAEYAPNLRGAGVHGALIKYEPKFNAQLLADLLCIPQSKTLLRRHLEMHFKNLLGRDIIQSKRDAENLVGYEPLTITSKMKISKKPQFSLKRRKSTKGIEEWSDYVCPTNVAPINNKTKNDSHDPSVKISSSKVAFLVTLISILILIILINF